MRLTTACQTASWVLIVVLMALAVCPAFAAAALSSSAVTSEILVTRQLAEARRLSVGQVVRIAVEAEGVGAREFRVIGIYEPTPDPFRLTARRWEVRMHLGDLVEMTADPGDPQAAEAVERINVKLADPADAAAFERDLEAKIPGVTAISARNRRGTNPFLVLERFHTAVAVVTVLGSTAFLLALMIMRSDERREAAGILRLIGLTRPRILLEVFVEAVFIAVAGAVVGVALATGLEDLFNRFFQWRYDTSLVFVRVTPQVAMQCVALALPLGVLAGIVASWALLRRNIMSLLRR